MLGNRRSACRPELRRTLRGYLRRKIFNRLQLRTWEVVAQNPLAAPAAAGQINGSGLGEPSAMAESSTVKEPHSWALSLNNKQRAGKRPQLTANLIPLEHPPPVRSHNGELKHAAAGATASHQDSLSPADGATGSSGQLLKTRGAVTARPTEPWMASAIEIPVPQQ